MRCWCSDFWGLFAAVCVSVLGGGRRDLAPSDVNDAGPAGPGSDAHVLRRSVCSFGRYVCTRYMRISQYLPCLLLAFLNLFVPSFAVDSKVQMQNWKTTLMVDPQLMSRAASVLGGVQLLEALTTRRHVPILRKKGNRVTDSNLKKICVERNTEQETCFCEFWWRWAGGRVQIRLMRDIGVHGDTSQCCAPGDGDLVAEEPPVGCYSNHVFPRRCSR